MQININGNVEKIIQSQLAAGNYRSAEELLEEMAAAWAINQKPAASGPPLPVMEQRIDPTRLAAEQGILPCDDVRQLQGIGWPMDDSIEEFEVFLRDQRDADGAGDRG